MLRVRLPEAIRDIGALPCVDGKAVPIRRLLWAPLMSRNDEGELRPWLAELTKVSNDGRRWTFRLDRRACWHDGAPVLTNDIAYSIGRMATQDGWRGIALQGHDERHFTIAAGEAGPELPQEILWMRPIRDPGSACSTGLSTSGPYRIETISHDAIRLQREAHYWGDDLPAVAGRFRLKQVEFVVIHDPVVALEALSKGDVDVIELNEQQYAALDESTWLRRSDRPQADGTRAWAMCVDSPRSVQLLGFNLRRPMFRDAHVRRTMGSMIDRTKLAAAVYAGAARACTSPLGLELPDSLPLQGHRAISQGELPHRFTISYNAVNTLRGHAVARLCRDFAEFGIEVDALPLDWSEYIGKLANGDFDTFLLSYSAGRGAADATIWRTEGARPPRSNFTGLSDARTDKLVDEMLLAGEARTYRALMARLDRRLRWLAPCIALTSHAAHILAFGARVQATNWTLADDSTIAIEDFWLDENSQRGENQTC